MTALGAADEALREVNPPLMLWVLLGLLALMAVGSPWVLRWLERRGGSLGSLVTLCAIWGTVGVGLAVLYAVFDLNIEQHGTLLWTVVTATALLGSTWVARRWRRVVWPELLVATVLVLEGSGLWLLLTEENPGLSDPAVRALLVAPAVIGLAGYFGASMGYLIWGEGERDLSLGYEALVGRRFLLSKASPVLSTVTAISLFGVALGVWLVIVPLAVLAGFEHDLQDKIIGAGSHVVVERHEGRSFELEPGVLEEIQSVPGVVAASPFLQGEVALASRSNYTGGLLLGIDPARSPAVLSVLRDNLISGSLEALSGEGEPSSADSEPEDKLDEPGEEEDMGFAPPQAIPAVILGTEMRKSLTVQPGEKVTVLSPLLEELTPLGPIPASRPFRQAGVFASGMYETDARFAFANINAVRQFFELGPRHVSGIHVAVADPEHADRIGAAVAAKLGTGPCAEGQTQRCGWRAVDWKSRNQTLFAALKLERVVAFVVLVFIILVASFSIVNTLTMSVIEKQKEISILKTMGARDAGIMKLFLVQGMLVGTVGIVLGSALAVGTVAALKVIGVWIPTSVYYIDSLPVHLEWTDVVLVVLAAILIVWDFAVFPALRGSKLLPVEGLRDG